MKEGNQKEISKPDAQSKSLYLSYGHRIALFLVLILLCSIFAVFFLSKSLSSKTVKQVTYQETSNLDYKVYLKKNDFYEDEYLSKNMVYVASLIKSIEIDFSYLFEIAEKSNIDFDYDIKGKLKITDSNGEHTFFEKDYTLLKAVKEKMKNGNQHKINQTINIDYGYYNNLANRFKTNYGLETNSNLIVYLTIHKKGDETNKFELDNNSDMSLTIPLSERAVNIKLDYKGINKNSQLFADSKIVISNYVDVIVGGLLILTIIGLSVPLIKLLLLIKGKQSNYDKYINKILREYDRLIVETSTAPDLEDSTKIIKINSFNELLDVRDNLNLPIKYYIINKHEKCNFYITHNSEVYLLVVKSTDLEK